MSDQLIIDIAAWCEEHLTRCRLSAKEASATCPWCDAGGGKFRVNLESGLYRCYKCHEQFSPIEADRSWGFFPRLVAKVEGISVGAAAKRCFEGTSTAWTPEPRISSDLEEPEIRICNDLPPEAIVCHCPLRDREWMVPKYLDLRLPRETISAFDLAYATKGRYAGRVLIPVKCPHGHSFTARKIGPGEPRYMNPDDAGFEHLLMGWDLLPDKPTLIVIVEGPFDCMRLHAHGIPAVALLGKNASESQIWLLAQLAIRGAEMIVMLDPEELVQQFSISSKLSPFTRVRIAKLPDGTDPGDSTDEQAWSAVMSATPYLGRTSEMSANMQTVENRLRLRR